MHRNPQRRCTHMEPTMKHKPALLAIVLILSLGVIACELSLPGGDTQTQSQSNTSSQVPAGFNLGDASEVEAFYASDDFQYLDDYAAESYSNDEYNTPGTLTFTVSDPGTDPVAVESSWCADTPDGALQEWDHIQNTFRINGSQVPSQYVYFDQWENQDGLGCVSDTVLFTAWPSGSHVIQVVINQDAPLGDIPAGDYIWVYTVTVP